MICKFLVFKLSQTINLNLNDKKTSRKELWKFRVFLGSAKWRKDNTAFLS